MLTKLDLVIAIALHLFPFATFDFYYEMKQMYRNLHRNQWI